MSAQEDAHSVSDEHDADAIGPNGPLHVPITKFQRIALRRRELIYGYQASGGKEMGDSSRDPRMRDALSDATEVGAQAEGTESLKANAIGEWGGTTGAARQHVSNVHRDLKESELVQRERIRERAWSGVWGCSRRSSSCRRAIGRKRD
eukprot:jgi/Tetstr1/462290/TSEL_007308.t1